MDKFPGKLDICKLAVCLLFCEYRLPPFGPLGNETKVKVLVGLPTVW